MSGSGADNSPEQAIAAISSVMDCLYTACSVNCGCEPNKVDQAIINLE